MGPLMVVLVKPALGCLSRFPNGLEQPAVQAAVSEHTVETLVVSILPRAPRVDEHRADPMLFDPGFRHAWVPNKREPDSLTPEVNVFNDFW